MSLSEWVKNGWLRAHQPTAQEVADLLGLAERDLKNAGAAGLDDDWRFSIAYNSVLQAASAALVASGHTVPKGDSHHFRVIGALAFTVGMDAKVVEKLDRYRKRRSMSIYDVAGVITAAEAKDIQEVARDLVGRVREWLKKSHPELLLHGK